MSKKFKDTDIVNTQKCKTKTWVGILFIKTDRKGNAYHKMTYSRNYVILSVSKLVESLPVTGQNKIVGKALEFIFSWP